MTDGKSVKYASDLNHAWQTASSREGQIYILKVKTHTKGESVLAKLNNQADQLAKQAARLGSKYTWDKTPIAAAVVKMPSPDLSVGHDILAMQKQDKDLQALLTAGKHQGYTICKDKNELIIARSPNCELPVLVMPVSLRKELITLAHSQGH